MSSDPTHIERLVLIKYMVSLADAQSQQPEPMSGVALLMYHDAIELFLGLAIVAFGGRIDEKKPDFGEYFPAIEKYLIGRKIAHVDAMKNMNRARVAFKHGGLLPSRDTIERSRADVARFLTDNIPTVFGALTYESLTLVDLVHNPNVKSQLIEAARLNASGDPVDQRHAMVVVGAAFVDLLDDYQRRKTLDDASPSVLAPDLSYPTHYTNQMEGHGPLVFSTLMENDGSLAEAIILLRLGIDGRKLARFEALTPRGATRGDVAEDGVEYDFDSPPLMEERDGFHFCLTFVVEVALQLQSFDFDLAKSPANFDSWAKIGKRAERPFAVRRCIVVKTGD